VNEILQSWLKSDDELLRRHAQFRLGLPIETPSYPSLLTQLNNAAHAVGRVASALVQGKKINVPQEEQARREAICRACEFFDASKERCTKCGCWASIKAWLKTEKCPIAKW